MSEIIILAKKEFKVYFISPLAYIYLTIFIAIQNWIFLTSFFAYPTSTMRGYFEILPWVFLFFIPAISMRLWAEEKRTGTFEVLLTLPLNSWEVVLGKFIGGIFFIAFSLLLTFTVPLTIAILGSPDWGELVGSYLGALLLGAAYLSIGCFTSSLTRNQVVSFIISVAIIFILLLLSQDFLLNFLPEALRYPAYYLSITYHFASISKGVIDSRDVVYFLSIILIFLLLNIYKIEGRRWL